MSRPKKCRKVCFVPKSDTFLCPDTPEAVTITLEEFEALRLSDYEGLEQDLAASRMLVSRGTYQRILRTARHKMAEALTTGKSIHISGGEYEILNETRCQNECKCCKFDS